MRLKLNWTRLSLADTVRGSIYKRRGRSADRHSDRRSSTPRTMRRRWFSRSSDSETTSSKPRPEPLTTLAFLATSTDTVNLGTGCTSFRFNTRHSDVLSLRCLRNQLSRSNPSPRTSLMTPKRHSSSGRIWIRHSPTPSLHHTMDESKVDHILTYDQHYARS